MKKKRLMFFTAFILLTIVEVFIAVYVHNSFVRGYLGDVFAAMAVYFFVRIFIPNGCSLLPLYVFLFAVGVEITQYFHLVDLLGMENNRVISIILGGTFDLMDILCYGIGCIIVLSISAVYDRENRK